MAFDRRTGNGKQPAWLIVDGYNIIGAWEDLRRLAMDDLAAARDRLADQLLDYCGHSGQHLLLVFDAHSGQQGERVQRLTEEGRHCLVYTRRGQTADQYIERFVRESEGELSVASSDGLVQVMIGRYAARLSALDLHKAVQLEKDARERRYIEQNWQKRSLRNRLSEDAASALEKLRQGLDDVQKAQEQESKAQALKDAKMAEVPKKKRRRHRRRKPSVESEAKKTGKENSVERKSQSLKRTQSGNEKSGKIDGGKRKEKGTGSDEPVQRQ